MKLLTLNTHSWQEENQLKKINIVAKAIIEQNCDVIALQEVNQHVHSQKLKEISLNVEKSNNKSLRENNYGFLLQQELTARGYEYQLTWDFVHDSYDVYQEGLSFLTRVPIVEKEVIDLNDDYNEGFWKHRRAVKIKIIFENREIEFFNCHCGWWDDKDSPFQEQIRRIKEKSSKNLTFYLGDFNNASHIRDQGYEYVLNNEWFDTYSLAENKDAGFTVIKNIDGWKENNNKLRIDYIFCNHPVKVNQHTTIFNQSFYPVVSDHFGVLVDLAV